MTRALTFSVALLALAGAGFVGLLASDVRHWEERLVRDDLSFRETPNRPDLFERQERIPGAARRLLAIDDDLAFRRALHLIWMSVAVRRRSRSQVAIVDQDGAVQFTGIYPTGWGWCCG